MPVSSSSGITASPALDHCPMQLRHCRLWSRLLQSRHHREAWQDNVNHRDTHPHVSECLWKDACQEGVPPTCRGACTMLNGLVSAPRQNLPMFRSLRTMIRRSLRHAAEYVSGPGQKLPALLMRIRRISSSRKEAASKALFPHMTPLCFGAPLPVHVVVKLTQPCILSRCKRETKCVHSDSQCPGGR